MPERIWRPISMLESFVDHTRRRTAEELSRGTIDRVVAASDAGLVGVAARRLAGGVDGGADEEEQAAARGVRHS